MKKRLLKLMLKLNNIEFEETIEDKILIIEYTKDTFKYVELI